jgi:hypothetical protein
MSVSELLIIVPTRGRPQVIADLWSSFEATSHGAASLLLAVDNDDPLLLEYIKVAATYSLQMTVGQRLRLGGTLNEVALQEADNYPYIGFMGDDHRPRSADWDVEYVEALKSNLFVYGNDLLQKENLPTQVAMRSSVVKTLGYMSPPGLVHMFIDNAWKAWGDGTGSIKYLPDVVVEHLHPAAGKASEDSNYQEVWKLMEPDSVKWREYSESNALATDIYKLKGLL